ncbi:MAG TPA: FliM/FliN family flagellar motor switch protein [Phycisphaerae bacterium]|nr:FliM/FliN family flagellar motor switch protein [Phycisphaerae bacterium]
MTTSQADIDSLLAQAENLAGEALGADSAPPSPGGADLQSPAHTPSPSTAAPAGPPSELLGRILRIEVPVIVKLAECKMPLARVVGLNTGAIIEFEKPADAPLDLMINNKCIGVGQAVKVGENFGLRITQVGTPREKIKALGA